MNINFDLDEIDFDEVRAGDVLLTATNQTFLIATDEDDNYRLVNLTNYAIYDEVFGRIGTLCVYLSDQSKIVKHIPSDKLLLSLTEGEDE